MFVLFFQTLWVVKHELGHISVFFSWQSERIWQLAMGDISDNNKHVRLAVTLFYVCDN